MLLAHPAVLPFYYFITSNVIAIPSEVFAPIAPAAEIDRSRNAVWLEHQWFQEGLSEAQVVALCKRLKENHIRYVYPHLSPSDADGNLPPFSVESARLFQKILKKECPDVQIFPWVGGVRVGYRQTREGTVSLESDSYLQKFGNECV